MTNYSLIIRSSAQYWLLQHLTLSYFTYLFFFNDTATTEIYTLSLHDALPICRSRRKRRQRCQALSIPMKDPSSSSCRSEEHTSELQSHSDLVCRLLLEKKKKKHDARYEFCFLHLKHVCTVSLHRYADLFLFQR